MVRHARNTGNVSHNVGQLMIFHVHYLAMRKGTMLSPEVTDADSYAADAYSEMVAVDRCACTGRNILVGKLSPDPGYLGPVHIRLGMLSGAAQPPQYLAALQVEHAFLGEGQGRGLLLGVERVDPEPRERWGCVSHDGARTRRRQQECGVHQWIMDVGGRQGRVLPFLPPLIVTPEVIDAMAERVADACLAVAPEGEVAYV